MAGRTTGVGTQQRETYKQHKRNTLPQLNSEVVNLTGLADTKD
jgi:hypothetical protein